jgi:hypothetical protein
MAALSVNGEGKRIAVLFHRRDHSERSSYIVDHLAHFWQEDGFEVMYLFGTRRFVPADLVFVHVDLSVVDDEYLRFAARYPIAVNGSVRDIRKSAISTGLVRPGDDWPGPVIVKTDLNYGGQPEATLDGGWLQRRLPISRRLRDEAASALGRAVIRSWTDYRIFDSMAAVPRSLARRRDLVVERFVPEVEDGLYHVRVCQFLGDRFTCTRLASPHPVFKAYMSVSAELTEPHAEVENWRRRLQMDYGKFDYVVHEDQPVLIDVNKTTGASRHMDEAALRTMRRHLAEGLYCYFS